MVTNRTPDLIADLSAPNAVLATSIVLDVGDQQENLRLWTANTRGFTPGEFLMLWNEVQSDISRALGVHSLVTRIQIFDDRTVNVDCYDLTDLQLKTYSKQRHNSN